MKTETLPVTAPPANSAPASRWTESGWLRMFLYLALLAVPAGIIVHLIHKYAVDVPFWDQWETARFFSVSKYGHESLIELARQQNESRLLFPNLIFLALSVPGNWSVVREMYFSVALIAGISAVLFALLRRTGFSLPVQAALLFVINWLLFSLSQHENWFFGIQICYSLPPTMLCLALLANVSGRSLRWKTLVCLALAFVSSYSFSGGVLICPLAFPGFLPSNWSASGRWLPRRRELAWHLLYVAVCAVMLAAYFWTYSEPAGAGSLTYIFKHLGASLGYFLVWLGSPFAPPGPVSLAMGIGIFAFLTLATLLALAAWWGLRDRAEQTRLYPWIMLAGYAVGTGLATVVGRSGFGIEQALSSRYIIFSNFTYIAILVLAAYLWRFHRQRVSGGVRTICLGGGMAALLAGICTFVNVELKTMPWIIDGSRHRHFAALGLNFLPLMPTSQNLDALCGVSDYIHDHALDLMRRGILNVSIVPKSVYPRLQRVTETGHLKYGELDLPEMDRTGKVSIRGWAVDPVKKQPAGKVLITCTGTDGVTHPLVALVTDLYRPPQAPAAKPYQPLPCAFVRLVSFDRLAPGEYRVAGWAIDSRTNRPHQIGGTSLFKWERSGELNHPLASVVFPPPVADAGNRYGSLEIAALKPGNQLEIQAWTMDPNTNAVPKAALITVTDRAGATRIVWHGGPREERQDVVSSLHNDSLTYCGVKAQVDLGQLPAGDYQVAGWAVGDDPQETPQQLSALFPIHIAPK